MAESMDLKSIQCGFDSHRSYLTNMKNKNSHPLETLIDFAQANGADSFWINNAKDELKRLTVVAEKNTGFSQPVAWANINSSGDLFNFSIVYNPYAKNLIPVYVKINDVQQAMSSISSN